MIFLELDPSTVRPGWWALVVVLLLSAAMVLLYLSMRRQFRKISIPREGTDENPATPTEPTPGSSTE